MQTKLFIPTARSRLVTRQALLSQLNAGLNAKLTLVATPAGFGKTTLIADWGNQMTHTKMCWVSLDQHDNDPARFLTYVVAAMQTAVSDFGQSIQVVLQSPQPPLPNTILALLVNEMAQLSTNICLVLDDYHLIREPAIHKIIAFLLENELPQFHLALGTRVDPPLPLSRLRARGQMTELRSADLRFTAVETAHFLNQLMGLTLTPAQIATLESRTEGWIVGLQLAALSMQGRSDIGGFIDVFTGSHRFIMDYLTDEALQQQDEESRQFLYQTSILHRFNSDLCDAVTAGSDSQKILNRLEKANLFILPLDDERQWYRYHQLFADLLNQRLRQTLPDNIPTLHQHAAAWYAQNGNIDDAIHHAIAANDVSYAANLMETTALDLLRIGRLSTLFGWMALIPESLVKDFPRLFLYFIWARMLSGKLDTVSAQLAVVEMAATSQGQGDELRGDFSAIRAYASSQFGAFKEAFAQAQDALEWLAETDTTVRAVMFFVLGGIYFMQQDLLNATKCMEEAGRLGELSGNLNTAVSALSAKANMQVQQDQLPEAEMTFDRALQLGTGHNGQPLPIAATVFTGLARLHIARHDLKKGRELGETAVSLSEKWGNNDSQVYGHLALAQIAHMEGNLPEAQRELAKAKQITETHTLTPNVTQDIQAAEATLQSTARNHPVQSSLIEPLSERELEVLRCIADGLSNKQIAEKLVIALGTVKAHTASIYGKLEVRSRTQAVARAQELNLI